MLDLRGDESKENTQNVSQQQTTTSAGNKSASIFSKQTSKRAKKTTINGQSSLDFFIKREAKKTTPTKSAAASEHAEAVQAVKGGTKSMKTVADYKAYSDWVKDKDVSANASKKSVNPEETKQVPATKTRAAAGKALAVPQSPKKSTAGQEDKAGGRNTRSSSKR